MSSFFPCRTFIRSSHQRSLREGTESIGRPVHTGREATRRRMRTPSGFSPLAGPRYDRRPLERSLARAIFLLGRYIAPHRRCTALAREMRVPDNTGQAGNEPRSLREV